jgi:hypothetical protein
MIKIPVRQRFLSLCPFLTALLIGQAIFVGCAHRQSRSGVDFPLSDESVVQPKATPQKMNRKLHKRATKTTTWEPSFQSVAIPEETFSLRKWFFDSFQPALAALSLSATLIAGFLLGQYLERRRNSKLTASWSKQPTMSS